MSEIKFSVNMQSWRGDERHVLEITKEQYEMIDKGYLTKDEQVEIFGGAAVYGYGLYGYEFYEEDGKYYTRYRQGDTCD